MNYESPEDDPSVIKTGSKYTTTSIDSGIILLCFVSTVISYTLNNSDWDYCLAYLSVRSVTGPHHWSMKGTSFCDQQYDNYSNALPVETLNVALDRPKWGCPWKPQEPQHHTSRLLQTTLLTLICFCVFDFNSYVKDELRQYSLSTANSRSKCSGSASPAESQHSALGSDTGSEIWI
jgi:hypothetical protein